MKIQILGSGCPGCKKLYELTREAVRELKLRAEVEYVTGDKGMGKIIELGVMQAPVLTVDDKPVMTGSTSDIEKVKSALTEGKSKDKECCGKCKPGCC